MAYITIDYLERRIGPAVLSGTVSAQNTPASMSGSVITDYIEDASSWVDSYLAPHLEVPLPSPPKVVLGLVADRCYANLLVRANLDVPEIIIQRLEDGVGYLNELRNNAIKMPNQPETTVKGVAGHIVTNANGGTKFQPKDLRGSYI